MNPRLLAVLLPVAILGTACSSPAAGPPSTAVSTPVAYASASPSAATTSEVVTGEVRVTMTDDMRFTPDPITVKAGAPITFIVKNAGLIVHEFVVGAEAEQVDHAAEMAKGEMAHGHGDALSVEPGDTRSLTMTFPGAGSFLVGCHEPGHYEAGMKATLTAVD